MVACGCEFTLVLDARGGVWSCGAGHRGQLGQGDDLDTYALTQINPDCFGGRAMSMIAVGGWHSMAVERDTGVLWTWGCNENGKLGQGHHLENTSLPASIDPATFYDNVAQAAAAAADAAGIQHSYVDDVVVSVVGGSDHTMAVTVAGVLWGCGNGLESQRGSGNRNVVSTFERVGGEDYFGIGGVRMVSCHQKQTLIVARQYHVGVPCTAVDYAGHSERTTSWRRVDAVATPCGAFRL